MVFEFSDGKAEQGLSRGAFRYEGFDRTTITATCQSHTLHIYCVRHAHRIVSVHMVITQSTDELAFDLMLLMDLPPWNHFVFLLDKGETFSHDQFTLTFDAERAADIAQAVRSLRNFRLLLHSQTIQVEYLGEIFKFKDQSCQNSVKIVETFPPPIYWYGERLGGEVTVFDMWRTQGMPDTLYLSDRPGRNTGTLIPTGPYWIPNPVFEHASLQWKGRWGRPEISRRESTVQPHFLSRLYSYSRAARGY